MKYVIFTDGNKRFAVEKSVSDLYEKLGYSKIKEVDWLDIHWNWEEIINS
jgi:hypothetical protein